MWLGWKNSLCLPTSDRCEVCLAREQASLTLPNLKHNAQTEAKTTAKNNIFCFTDTAQTDVFILWPDWISSGSSKQYPTVYKYTSKAPIGNPFREFGLQNYNNLGYKYLCASFRLCSLFASGWVHLLSCMYFPEQQLSYIAWVPLIEPIVRHPDRAYIAALHWDN